MTQRQPMSRPNEVGETLRRFRDRAGLSTRELARRTRVTASYVSKVELGHLGPKREFCQRVASVLRLQRAEKDLLDALLALHQVEHQPVLSRGDALRAAQEAIRKLERGCRNFRGFQLSLVPGLLQTHEYTEALFSGLTPRSRIAAAVQERRGRQGILKDQSRSFQFLLSDWALGPHWCSEAVLARQVKHMQALARRPNIHIRTLPRECAFPQNLPPLVTGFEILDESIVIVDTLRGLTTFRKQEDVRDYVEAFTEVFPVGRSLPGAGSRAAA